MNTGLHTDIPVARYHADDFGDVPTLSSSIAKVLLDEAPIKAKMAHPRLCGGVLDESEPTRVKEIGTAAHKLILGRGCDVVEIAAGDYKTGAAKEQRRNAYIAGKCPILAPDMAKADLMAATVRAGIGGLPDCAGFLSPGTEAEVVVIADHPSGARLRIMIDKLELRDDGTAIIWDLKTGEQSAAPHTLGARVSNMGMDLQAEFYREVLALALPHFAGRISHRFLFVENDEPHLFLPVELDATAREMGRRKTSYAVALWNECLATGDWPGYPAAIVVPEYPSYAHTKWLAREDAFEAAGIRPALPTSAYVPKKLMEAC